MKKVIIICLIFNALLLMNKKKSVAQSVAQQPVTQEASSCRVQYLRKVLSDTGSFIPWLVIKIVESQKERSVAVQNQYLYKYLNRLYGYDFKTYYDKMFSLLIMDKPLYLKSEINQLQFFKLDTSLSARKLLREKGIDALWTRYYSNIQPNSISLYALDIFFEYNYIIRRGDINPALSIMKFNCK